jgi:Spy/CpxP family protein refolding chaperone
MSLKSVILSLGALALVPAAALADDQNSAPAGAPAGHPGFSRHAGGDSDSLGMLLHSAHLTADQQAQVKSLMHAERTQMKPLFEQRRELRSQIADLLLKAGSVDSAQLEALVQKDEALEKQISEQHLQTAVQVRNLLTADQLAKVAQTRTQMKALHTQMQSIMQQQ